MFQNIVLGRYPGVTLMKPDTPPAALTLGTHAMIVLQHCCRNEDQCGNETFIDVNYVYTAYNSDAYLLHKTS